MVKKLAEFCSITWRPWEDGGCKCVEGSVKAIKRQDGSEGPAGTWHCRKMEGRRRYCSREVRPGKRKGPYGTAFLL